MLTLAHSTDTEFLLLCNPLKSLEAAATVPVVSVGSAPSNEVELTSLRNLITGLQNQVNNLANRIATLEHERHEERVHGGLPDVAPGVDHNTGGETGGDDENMVDRDAGSEHGETGTKDGETAGENDEA
ncbi:hypothetical protein NM208_g7429 [Fusarium decemcellulare]|uniref:Uncharacterized protein n=1 Tax=Fusarium decemcellulare TaxID=57161 RepID=A0ACC1S9A4_9HYPO|nr:hypothetical protein NM208_g7429 [Fusarium decemcellulare]